MTNEPIQLSIKKPFSEKINHPFFPLKKIFENGAVSFGISRLTTD